MENTFWDCSFLPSTEEQLPASLPLVAQNDQASASMSTEELLQPAGNIEERAFDSDVVPSSLLDITPILRVANEVEPSNSRIAYLCRFYAFEKAHKLDPTCIGRGVRQFKTALIQRLERDDSQSCLVRGEKSDARETQSFYRHYTTTYIPSLQNSADKADSAKLTKINQTATVLFEVLKAVNGTESTEIDNETEELLPPSPHLVPINDQSSGDLPPPLPLPSKEGAYDSEVVPSSLVGITPILRVANEIEPSNSRVAYLCRFYAYEKAHKLDPTYSGRGVRQFKTALLQRLERDDEPSLSVREKNSDAREMQSFYRHYTTTYIPSLQNSADKADSAKLTKVNQTAGVLFEVLKAVNWTDSIETDNDQASDSKSTEELLPPSPPSLPLPQRPIGQEQPAGNLEEGAFEVVPSSLLEITPILRVANEVEPINSRVAYLCRFYAFEKAHKLDPTSSGCGVHQFKTALIQRLEGDNSRSLSVREKNNDAREMQSFYRHFTTTYIPSLQNSADKADRI